MAGIAPAGVRIFAAFPDIHPERPRFIGLKGATGRLGPSDAAASRKFDDWRPGDEVVILSNWVWHETDSEHRLQSINCSRGETAEGCLGLKDEYDEILLSSCVAWCSGYFFTHAFQPMQKPSLRDKAWSPVRGHRFLRSLLGGLAVVKVTISSQSPGA